MLKFDDDGDNYYISGKPYDISADIVNQKYLCPKCGEVEWYIDVTIPGYEGKYCQKCYAKWIKENMPLLKPIE